MNQRASSVLHNMFTCADTGNHQQFLFVKGQSQFHVLDAGQTGPTSKPIIGKQILYTHTCIRLYLNPIILEFCNIATNIDCKLSNVDNIWLLFFLIFCVLNISFENGTLTNCYFLSPAYSNNNYKNH